MPRRLAVFDLDGTVFRWQLDHAVMLELEDMGAIQGFRQALRETYTNWKNRKHPESFGEYTTVFDVVTAQYLKAVPLATFSQAAQQVVNQSGERVHTYTRHLIADLRSQDYAIAAISGSLRQIVQPFAQFHGFDLWRGQDLGISGKYFAKPYGSFSPEQKGAYLLELCEAHGFALNGSVGIGDTMSDVSMLLHVERPIVFNPDRELMRYAMRQGWRIVIERKNVVVQLTSQDGRYGLDRELVLHLASA